MEHVEWGRVVLLAEEQWGLFTRQQADQRESINVDLVGAAAVMTAEAEPAPALARIGLVELD